MAYLVASQTLASEIGLSSILATNSCHENGGTAGRLDVQELISRASRSLN